MFMLRINLYHIDVIVEIMGMAGYELLYMNGCM
jgi:hypothetical protein